MRSRCCGSYGDPSLRLGIKGTPPVTPLLCEWAIRSGRTLVGVIGEPGRRSRGSGARIQYPGDSHNTNRANMQPFRLNVEILM